MSLMTQTEIELATLRLYHRNQADHAQRKSTDNRASRHTVQQWRKEKAFHQAALRTLENCSPKHGAP